MKFYDSAERQIGKKMFTKMLICVHSLLDVQFLDECNLGLKTTQQTITGLTILFVLAIKKW